jgi:DMSO/TMAO reductase YedYZ molybdopterin-dependent catalytic subunit
LSPEKISAAARYRQRGTAARQISQKPKLSLAEIKKMPAVDIVAVNQCSGNSRGFFNPRVAGGQLGNGAMGYARWRGVPLKTVLDRAGVQPGARLVTFNGIDGPVTDNARKGAIKRRTQRKTKFDGRC